MSMTFRYLIAFGIVAFIGILFTFERPPVDVVQSGFRGLAMEQVYNPRVVAAQIPRNQPPERLDPVEPAGDKASAVYQNVQVLGDLTEVEFLRTMQAITNWVSPEAGCLYCHAEGEELSSDSLYTKVVSRRMLQMTKEINSTWKPHVAETGVNCYTCHRGQPVPANIWFDQPPRRPEGYGMAGNPANQNIAAPVVGRTSLPNNPFETYLASPAAPTIRVNGNTALPTGNRSSIKQTEWTYGLMIHMSESLGVNCTYCHNSRQFSSWEESPPTRATAWWGIEMLQVLNAEYLNPLQPVYPAVRLGPTGDAPKANCTTCHQGAYKPLYGAPMVEGHPELAVPNPPGTAGRRADASPAVR